MRKGGNDNFNQFLLSKGVPKNCSITQKYNTSAAQYFRERLSAEVNGLPMPSKQPEFGLGNTSNSNTIPTSTEPIPGETEAQYVERQRRLQSEAKERLRQKFGNSNGLSSNGSMQGIGSDPNYRRGETSAASDSFDLNQISGFFSSLGETVSKVSHLTYF